MVCITSLLISVNIHLHQIKSDQEKKSEIVSEAKAWELLFNFPMQSQEGGLSVSLSKKEEINSWIFEIFLHSMKNIYQVYGKKKCTDRFKND